VKEVTLDPTDWEKAKTLGRQMVTDMITFLETVRDRPVWRPVPASVKQRLRAPLPQEGLAPEAVYDEFRELILPYGYGSIHPRFWAWVNGTGTVFTVLSELLAATMNPNCYGSDSSPFYVEQQVLAWMKDFLGFPQHSSGLLLSGASIANFVALAAALEAKADGDIGKDGLRSLARPMILYTSEETHYSVEKAVRMLGLGTRSLRKIPVDSNFAIDLDTLFDVIELDRKKGHKPFCVVGNAGTVRTGAFDDLQELATLCHHEGLWFHVDGAFGALVAASTALAGRALGMERADSVGFDLHKWMFMPIEVGCVFIRDEESHRKAFEAEASYLAQTESGIASVSDPFGNYGPELTRGFRALKVWMGLKEHGANKYVQVIEQNVSQAAYLSGLVDQASNLELLAPVPLNIVCFRFAPQSCSSEDLNEINRRLLLALQDHGLAAPSLVSVRGKIGLRVAITNHRTRRSDLDFLVEVAQDFGRRIVFGGSV
jgi:glutamate/tyrosine decarboxylase-like PLP-dependent enzyme